MSVERGPFLDGDMAKAKRKARAKAKRFSRPKRVARKGRPGKASRKVPRSKGRLAMLTSRAALRKASPEGREADRTRKIAILKDRAAKRAWRMAKQAAEKAQTLSELASRKQRDAQVLGDTAIRKQREAKEAWGVAKQALLRLAEFMNRRRALLHLS